MLFWKPAYMNMHGFMRDSSIYVTQKEEAFDVTGLVWQACMQELIRVIERYSHHIPNYRGSMVAKWRTVECRNGLIAV
jgi:hypothetical protein